MTNNPEINEYGNKIWRNSKGQTHRENGLPAVECVDGSKGWYKNGQYHREDGPAIEYADGTEYWLYEGELIK